MTMKRPDQKQEIHTANPLKPELAETIFSSDVEDKVYQGIVLEALSSIEGIKVLDNSFLDSLIGRQDRIKGILIEQEPTQRAVKIQIEVIIQYGTSIPEKAEEIQNKVAREVTKMTGVHVSEVHVIFRDLLNPNAEAQDSPSSTLNSLERSLKKDLDDEF